MFAAFASLNRRQPRRKPTGWIALLIIIVLVATPSAQQMQTAFNAAPAATAADALPSPTDVSLLVGRSTVLNVGSTIARVSLTVPDIADAMVTAPSQILIHGKQPGTISLFVWDKAGVIKTFEVTVRRDLSALKEHMKQLFPGEAVTVIGSGKDVVLSGTVSGQYVIDKAAAVAGGYVEKKENVVNLLKQQEGVASNQVMLRVRFAEVSRNALQELGASLFSDGREGRFARTTTQQFAAPFFDESKPILGRSLVFSDYLNLFLFDAKEKLGAVVKALQSRGVFQSLAEPNLIALNGKEASFLAGGEFPIPVVQGGATNAITILFKEFGVRLNFTPTVLGGDLINLKLSPEVSALDFNNAIVVEGFRVPALTSRRANTEIELRDGQTFAIAGLMNNTAVSSMRKVPGLGDIPILGMLFRSRAYQKDQTELVVMVTPHIVRRDSTGVSEGLPSLVEPYLGAPDKRIPPPAPYLGSPRFPSSQSAPGSSAAATQPAPGANAAGSPTPTASAPAASTPRQVTKETSAAKKAAQPSAKQRAADQKRQEEADRAAARRAAKDKEQADRIARERAKRDAELAKKSQEQARRKAEEDAKKEKAIAEAAARLKEAQAAYEAQVAKVKTGGGQ